MNIGEKLYELRKEKHLSQEEVAEKLDVTRQTISKWETNQSTPDFDKIKPLCELYGITADELITGEKKERIEQQMIQQDVRHERAQGIASAVFLYIISIVWIMISIPVLMMNPIVASGIFIGIIGLATYKIIYTCIVYKRPKEEKKDGEKNPIIKRINNIIDIIGFIIYMLVSIATMAWHITWIIFIICGLIKEIVKLIFELKQEQEFKKEVEGEKNEE